MTTKADFTEEEWARLERSPIVAAMAISLADPGGPIEAVKESMAAIKTVTGGGAVDGQPELIREVAKSFTEKTRARQSPMKDFRPKGALAGQEILDELRAVNEHRHAEGDARGGRGLPRVAPRVRQACGRRGEGGRLHGLQGRARERGRAGHARQARRGPR